MSKKPKTENKDIVIVVGGVPVTVHLYPPLGRRKSWYVYWSGLRNGGRSTGQREFDQAVRAAESMVRNGGDRIEKADVTLSNEEFIEIQRRHFLKKRGDTAQQRAQKSLRACLEAVTAFEKITGLENIASAMPSDCEKFQNDALKLPKNWRAKHPKSMTDVARLSANTVVKWCVALRAAFERANGNAGRKCVRGVVADSRLLSENPWDQFQWIEGFDREIRQFDYDELRSILDFFSQNWGEVTVATLAIKVFLWSWGRREEVAHLRWNGLRRAGDEYHFEIVGKWGVQKWFQVPSRLFQELADVKTDSNFLFAAFNDQIRAHYRNGREPWRGNRVTRDYVPKNFGDWLYRRIKDWEEENAAQPAYLHTFRKSTLQYARAGEDVNKRVAGDARVGKSVMMKSYVRENDEELRQASNRIFTRIVASLPVEIARMLGNDESVVARLKGQLTNAVVDENWSLAEQLSTELANRHRKD